MREWLKKYIAFVFYGAAWIVLISAARLNSDYSLPASGVLLLAGLLSWAFLEYSIHRFAFHSNPKKTPELLSAYHRNHHRNPKSTDDLFMNLPVSIPIATGYYLLAWVASGSWQASSYLFCGLLGGYFAYEYVHYQVHHGSCASRPLAYMKEYHLGQHHRAPKSCYGLTSPLIDILFGTFKSVKAEGRRSKVTATHRYLSTERRRALSGVGDVMEIPAREVYRR
jgi:sterol desaturase/sphingolipid hydroxylase (fatty acid hydroxylase superfamily)